MDTLLFIALAANLVSQIESSSYNEKLEALKKKLLQHGRQ